MTNIVCVVQNPAEASITMSVEDLITLVSAALLTLLRRDMSLNRRLYAWLLGNNHYNVSHFSKQLLY